MTENEKLLNVIIDAVQEKKGKNISIVDMSSLETHVCDYFVICEGNTNIQIMAIADSICETVRKQLHQKPFSMEGQGHALWVAMDYGDVMVHIFEKNTRQFYDLEHLWSDASLTDIPNLD